MAWPRNTGGEPDIACFRKLRGVKLPYIRQGLIRFTCLNYAEQAPDVREKIDRLCAAAGGDYASALFDVMCTGSSIVAISMRHHVSESTLYRARVRFYAMWDER